MITLKLTEIIEPKIMAVKILMSDGVVDLATEYYCKALESVGCEVKHSYLPKLDLDCDGLLLSGGADINPKYYGEEINGSVNVDDARDSAEYKLFNAYFKAGKPIFGICRGCQFINVLLGGSLVQHLDCCQNHVDGKFHTVKSEKDSIIYALHGQEFITNSFHHQAINKLGKGLKATAFSENGSVIEAIEHEEKPIFAVQWHPERMVKSAEKYILDALTAGAEDEQVLFKKFIDICEQYKGE